jgi:predicted dehydrogenase
MAADDVAATGLRFAVLGTGHWARTVHAASLAGHPTAELVGVWGRDLAKAKAVGAEFDVPGTDDLDALLADVDAVSIALPPHVQAPLAERAALAGKHLLLEKPIALSVEAADRLVAAAEASGVASVVFVTARFRTATSSWLEQAGRTTLAGGSMTWLGARAGSPFDDSPWRDEHGALWDLGPHALSLLVPTLGPVEAVQVGAGQGDTVHLVLTHPGGRASTVTLSHTVAPLATGIETWVHGDAGRIVLLPDYENSVDAHQVAVEELAAAALTGGAHPCDVAFGRDVVRVLAAAQRALESGCRETVDAVAAQEGDR